MKFPINLHRLTPQSVYVKYERIHNEEHLGADSRPERRQRRANRQVTWPNRSTVFFILVNYSDRWAVASYCRASEHSDAQKQRISRPSNGSALTRSAVYFVSTRRHLPLHGYLAQRNSACSQIRIGTVYDYALFKSTLPTSVKDFLPSS